MRAKLVLVSACLSGRRCRYDGKDVHCPEIKRLVDRGKAVPFCPELAGGLSIPRPPAEIQGGSGKEVLTGEAKVVNVQGRDVSAAYKRGAQKGVALAEELEIEQAILKEKSPACGVKLIYDGSFEGRLVEGEGVLAAALKEAGVKVKAAAT